MAEAKNRTLASRILAIQNEMGALSKDLENPHFKYKYFDINQLVEQLTPLLVKYGVTVTQPLTTVRVDKGEAGDVLEPVLRTIVRGNNEELEYNFPLGTWAKPQDLGAIVTYYRRYSLQSLFLLHAEDNDAAVKPKKATSASSTTTAEKFTQALEMVQTFTTKEDIATAAKQIRGSKLYNAEQKKKLLAAMGA